MFQSCGTRRRVIGAHPTVPGRCSCCAGELFFTKNPPPSSSCRAPRTEAPSCSDWNLRNENDVRRRRHRICWVFFLLFSSSTETRVVPAVAVWWRRRRLERRPCVTRPLRCPPPVPASTPTDVGTRLQQLDRRSTLGWNTHTHTHSPTGWNRPWSDQKKRSNGRRWKEKFATRRGRRRP